MLHHVAAQQEAFQGRLFVIDVFILPQNLTTDLHMFSSNTLLLLRVLFF